MTTADPRPGVGVVVAATCLGFVLVQLDVSTLNVALPSIATAFGSHVGSLQWVVDAYTVAFASLLLSAGTLGDRVGARRVFCVGFAVFIAASCACGFAPDIGTLIAARVVQGVGAALLVPCSLALLTHACGDDLAARTRAIGAWTAAASVALAAGPPLGGVLVHAIGWRSIFLMNLPLGITGIVLARRYLAETPQGGGGIDWPGQILGVLALTGLTGAVIEAGSRGGSAAIALTAAIMGVLSALLFLVVETRAAHPLLPLRLFRQRTFSAASTVGFFVNLTLYGAIFVIGLYLQQVRKYSPIQAGLAFLPFPVALGLANLAAGRLADKAGYRVGMGCGLLLASAGFALLGRIGVFSSYSLLLPGLILIPAGVGLVVPTMTSALLGTVPRTSSGTASGVLNTVRQAGGALGVAMSGAAMANAGVPGLQVTFAASCGLLLVTAGIAALLIQMPPRDKPSGLSPIRRLDKPIQRVASRRDVTRSLSIANDPCSAIEPPANPPYGPPSA